MSVCHTNTGVLNSDSSMPASRFEDAGAANPDVVTVRPSYVSHSSHFCGWFAMAQFAVPETHGQAATAAIEHAAIVVYVISL
jgi:hypothetical protein